MALHDPTDAGRQAPQIAVCVDGEGNLTGHFEESFIRLYERQPEAWLLKKEIPFRIAPTTGGGFSTIRKAVDDAADELEGCSIMIIGPTKGAVATLLGDVGITVFVSEHPVGAILEQIDRNREAAPSREPSPALVVKPWPVGDPRDGVYHFDLQAALKADESLDSKEVLGPFLEKRSFRRLTVVCEGIPPWLDATCKEFNLQSETHDTPERSGLKLIICPGS